MFWQNLLKSFYKIMIRSSIQVKKVVAWKLCNTNIAPLYDTVGQLVVIKYIGMLFNSVAQMCTSNIRM